jgi:hypothetical protein
VARPCRSVGEEWLLDFYTVAVDAGGGVGGATKWERERVHLFLFCVGVVFLIIYYRKEGATEHLYMRITESNTYKFKQAQKY